MVKIHNLGTDRPYLALPDPFSRYKLTLLEEEDLPTITSILSNEPISQYLNTVPELYTLDDAKYWYNLQPSNANIRNLRESTGTKEEQEEQKQVLMSRFPFSVIRDSESGLLVGYFSIRRNEWEWMEGFDPSGRASLRQANDRRKDGDEAISYSIGYYMSPDVSSKGLMTAVMNVALSYAKEHMNAKYVQGICRHDNIASKRVMEKNGFAFIRQVEMPLKKGGTETEYVFDKLL